LLWRTPGVNRAVAAPAAAPPAFLPVRVTGGRGAEIEITLSTGPRVRVRGPWLGRC
jgi:hypothetical protein